MRIVKHWEMNEEVPIDGTDVNVLQAPFMPDANSDYLILVGATMSTDATSTTMSLDLFQNTTSTRPLQLQYKYGSTTNYLPVFGGFAYTSGASPSQEVFILLGTNTPIPPSTAAGSIRNRTITIIKLGADDHYAWALTGVVNTGVRGKWTTAQTLTFTPSSSSDYLVFAFGTSVPSTNSVIHNIRLKKSTTYYGVSTMRRRASGDQMPWGTMQKFTGLSGSQTFNIRHKSGTSGTGVTIGSRLLVALRVDDADNHYWNRNITGDPASNGTTSYTTRATTTNTPAAADHFVAGSMILSADASLPRIKGKVDDGTDTFQETIISPLAADVDYPMMSFNARPYTAASTTWRTQWAKQSGFGNAKIEDSAVSVLDLYRAGSVNIKGASIKGANIL